ncbi:MAG: hypothetical protein U0K80_03350 [Methanobrevibacter sp.]|nr:hypothetical protein [Methanobrevibacter sp.]
MSEQDIKNKNLVLIDYLRSIINDYKIRAEYSTSDKDIQVIVVTETSGEKIVLWETDALYNYYDVNIYGDKIKNAKETSVDIGNLIGKNIYFNWNNQKWQIMIKQFSNPRTIAYEDIRRISYTMTLQCIVNRIS